MNRKHYVAFVISLLLCLWWGQIATAQPDANNLAQQGVELYQQGRITQAIDNWETALKSYDRHLDGQTIILENLARAYQQLGQSDRALDYWQQTSSNYHQLGNMRQLERSLTEQAQIYARLGQHRRAIAILCGADTKECLPDSAIGIARQQQDKLGEAAARGSLGETYRLRGNYQPALSYLESSLAISTEAHLTQLEISALNSLGNTYSSLALVDYRRAASAQKRGEDFGSNNLVEQLEAKGLKSDRLATQYLSKSLQLARKQGNKTAQLKTIINSLPIYYRLGSETTARVQQALSLLPEIPTTTDKVYATIDLAKLLQPESITPHTCYSQSTQANAKKLLEQAVSEAETLNDFRSLSFA